jgi:XTP/dITP diphosphohydrolase
VSVPDAAGPRSVRRLVIATLNRPKGLELARLLADLPFELSLLADVAGASLPEETGETYHENALLKARAAARATGFSALADDSGLEVDALGGAPGVRSARFGGSGLDDAARCARLLDALVDVPDERRTAHYRCVIALVGPDGHERTVEGTVEGTITRTPRGSGGFGYDPIFFHRPLGRTFGELSAEEKDRLSHRAAAVAALRAALSR